MNRLIRLLLALVFMAVAAVWLDQGKIYAADAVIHECNAANGQGALCDGPETTAQSLESDTAELTLEATRVSTAKSSTDDETACPQVVGDGVLCTGPTQEMQLVVGEGHPCPMPIGEGVVCTGPDIPPIGSDEIPAQGMETQDPQQVPSLFLPFVGAHVL